MGASGAGWHARAGGRWGVVVSACETIERYWAEAKEKYKWRASTAEWVNAQVRNRGKYQVRVRGLKKVLTVTLWQVLTHHFERILIHGSACLGEGARIGK